MELYMELFQNGLSNEKVLSRKLYNLENPEIVHFDQYRREWVRKGWVF